MGPPKLVASGLPLERPYTFRKCVMEERRRVQRTRVLKGAKIILKGRSAAPDCTSGHKTSVSLEDAFWKGLKEIASARNRSASDLIASIDAQRNRRSIIPKYDIA
jgi:hypothetical protein